MKTRKELTPLLRSVVQKQLRLEEKRRLSSISYLEGKISLAESRSVAEDLTNKIIECTAIAATLSFVLIDDVSQLEAVLKQANVSDNVRKSLK